MGSRHVTRLLARRSGGVRVVSANDSHETRRTRVKPLLLFAVGVRSEEQGVRSKHGGMLACIHPRRTFFDQVQTEKR